MRVLLSLPAIEIDNNPVQYDRTKHVEIDRYFIKEKIKDGIIVFPFVKLEQQLANIRTKTVASKALSNSLDKLRMCDIHAPTSEGVLESINCRD